MQGVLLFLFGAGALAQAQLLTPVWIELGEQGRAIARVVASSTQDCPSIQIDGVTQRMKPREPVPSGFRPACELSVPQAAASARVNGRELALPRRSSPSRIVVIGDTGCRINGERLQACKDSSKWPFERVARTAAAARPQLIIHVGDYLYREDPCPEKAQAECGGTPFGDNWNAWDADFFTPAARLLAAAPWVFSRGNHESCPRSWRGWFYYLDPHDWQGGACPVTPPPYLVRLGTFQLIAFDSSGVTEGPAEPGQRNQYAAELAGLKIKDAWLVDHHPFFAIKPATAGLPPAVQTPALQEAWDRAAPAGIDMILSGHTHLFEALSYGSSRPLQIVVGDGGTSLDGELPETVNGMNIEGIMVASSQNQRQFGYVLLDKTRSGWNLTLKSPADRAIATCQLQGRQAICKSRDPVRP